MASYGRLSGGVPSSSPFTNEKIGTTTSGSVAIIPYGKLGEDLKIAAVHVGHKKLDGLEGLPGSILSNSLLRPD